MARWRGYVVDIEAEEDRGDQPTLRHPSPHDATGINWDEIVGVFIREKVWLENSLSQSEGGGTGRGRVRVQKQAVEGKDRK